MTKLFAKEKNREQGGKKTFCCLSPPAGGQTQELEIHTNSLSGPSVYAMLDVRS